MPDESLFGLAGRRALVTGGSRGIGAATARLLARAGADVALTYRTRQADAEAVAAEVTALGRRASVHRVELADRKAVDAMIDGIASAWGGLDILVGNAGIWPSDEAAVRDMPDERWSRTMAENVDGMFYSTRAALARDGRRRPGGARVQHGRTARRVDACRLRGVQGRDDLVREVGGHRGGAPRHHREQRGARLGRHRDVRRPLCRWRTRTDRRRASRLGGSPRPTTSPRRSCSCAPAPRATSPARSST